MKSYSYVREVSNLSGCASIAALPALRVCSRALMRDFAAIVLCSKR